MSILQSLFASFRDLGDSLRCAFLGETSSHQLSASFGDFRNLLATSNKGLCIDGKASISLKQNRSNVAVIGPSGKGKSQVAVFGTLLRATNHCSYIINDVSGEISTCIPYLHSVGIKILNLDFGKITGLNFNPLEDCKGSVTEMKKVASTLVRASNSNSTKQDFWIVSATDTLVIFIQFVLESLDPKYHNLANVYRLILEYQGDPEVIELLFAEKASEAVFQKFKALSGASENTRKSIISSSLSSLSFLGDDPTLCEITSHSNIIFQDFRESPHALFVHVPVSDTSFYAPILSLFFQDFYRFAFSRIPGDEELDVMMMLDEFDTLGAISDYSSIISNSRKFKIPQNIFLQSRFQLSKYGDQAKTILNNCAVKCYYGGLGTEESEELERNLGKYEYTVDKERKQTKTRSLMTASEIREMKGEILVFQSGEKPLKVNITEAYKQPTLMKRLNMPEGTKRELDQKQQETKTYLEYFSLEAYRKQLGR
jgi:type IV secretory pathway TraG/TraD family ATPase VirD4